MAFLASAAGFIGLFALIAVAIFVGTLIGSSMKFGRFGSSGVAILGSGGGFALCSAIALCSAGGIVSWVFIAIAAVIFGVIMRGAGS
jgi:hypothetical protein